ncbi:MAG TPA: DNA polymerase III subunit chi [Steroidobacteraceae bacterium]|jgi:DNA polymerase-3 subunit chi|nr:DNA polymerase III subunit chi [Steroidobacteraceae bacterium]
MGESDGTSGSAASSGADSSPPASFTGETLRVDFYVIEGTAPGARLRVACRLAEKAYLASQRALIWHTDRRELEALDELLWTFADGSFVPHDWLTSNGDGGVQAPVLLSAGSPPAEIFDFVINLAAEPPPFLHLARRIAEIIDGDEGRRQAGRVRFKAYRELGIGPVTHPLRAE